MWENIYSSSAIVVNQMVVKLKREADSLEVDIQTFVIIPVTVSKNMFTGSVVNNTKCMFQDTFFKQLIQISSRK